MSIDPSSIGDFISSRLAEINVPHLGQITIDGYTDFFTGQPLDRSQPITQIGPGDPTAPSSVESGARPQVTLDGTTDFFTGKPLDPSKPIVNPLTGSLEPSTPSPPSTPSTPSGGAAPAPIAEWQKFVVWLGAVAVLWLVLTLAAETGNQQFAYAFAALLLIGALFWLGPKAIDNAKALVKSA